MPTAAASAADTLELLLLLLPASKQACSKEQCFSKIGDHSHP
jgi:hypothetical protein